MLGLHPIRYNRVPGLEFDMMNVTPGKSGLGILDWRVGDGIKRIVWHQNRLLKWKRGAECEVKCKGRINMI